MDLNEYGIGRQCLCPESGSFGRKKIENRNQANGPDE